MISAHEFEILFCHERLVRSQMCLELDMDVTQGMVVKDASSGTIHFIVSRFSS